LVIQIVCTLKSRKMTEGTQKGFLILKGRSNHSEKPEFSEGGSVGRSQIEKIPNKKKKGKESSGKKKRRNRFGRQGGEKGQEGAGRVFRADGEAYMGRELEGKRS